MPIIAIILPDHETLPIEMNHFANWIIKWDSAAIKNTIFQAQEKIINDILKSRISEGITFE